MLGYLIILFTVVPAVELYLLIEIGSYIGAGNTILIIILTGIIGAYLARLEGFYILRKIQNNLNQGLMPNEELLDGAMVLAGGIVLLTPGFITDAIGFLLLIPFSRALIKQGVKHSLKAHVHPPDDISMTAFRSTRHSDDPYDDIDIT
jgi:UPF0716 protein FxsA